MGYECRIEADSISPDGHRLTTMVVTCPRIILCELLTHRALSRNAASSRAIPVEKMIAAVEADPFVPEQFGKNQRGMRAADLLSRNDADAARETWLAAKSVAVNRAMELAKIGVHKQLANRLLEPFAWVAVVVTATDWANFFALRCHPDAQPEFQKIAGMMREAMDGHLPNQFSPDDPLPWHLPFLRGTDWADWEIGDLTTEQLKLVSAGRCARVSYLGHDGRRDPEADIALARRLIESKPVHASPLEHVATPMPGRHANLAGWRSMRLDTPGHVVEEEAAAR